MNFAIICSNKNPSSVNIKEFLLKFNFKETDEEFENNKVFSLENIKIYTIDSEETEYNNIDEKIQADLFVFASTHQSAANIHSLSVHTPGNWGKDVSVGGLPNKLCIAPALYLRKAFLLLNKYGKDLNYEVSVEQTHHGPYLNKPCFFIEIGSSLKQWQDKNAGNVIAKTIMGVLTKPIPKYKTAILLGGGHYNQLANKIMLRTNIAVGHICAKHMLPFIDKGMLNQAINKNMEKIDIVLLDWKGLGQYKNKIIDLLNQLDLKYERAQRLLK